MPQMGSQLPEGDRMESARERIRRQEGIGRRRGDHAGPDSSGMGSQRRRGDHADSGGGTGRSRGEHQDSDGLYNENGDTGANEEARSRTPSELDDDEEAAAGLYNDDGTPQKGWRRKIVRRYWKRAAFGGGIAGMTITGLVMFMSVAQGPLEFVHLAQLLEKFHFASLEDAQDGRLMKIIRYIHDPSKPEKTRLGIVGNIAADHLETKMNEATGLESKYNSDSGRFEGYEVIRDNPKWEGKNTAAIRSELAEKYNVDPSTVELSVNSEGKQSIRFNPDPGGLNSIKRYRAQTSVARELLKEGGYSKLASHVGSRILGKRAGWTFHPIRALDKAIQAKAIEGGKSAYKKLKDKLSKQFKQQEADYEAHGDSDRKPGGKPDSQKEKTADGKDVDNPDYDKEAEGAKDVQTQSEKLDPTDESTKTAFTDHVSAKIAGGGLGLVGIACLVRNLSSSIDGLRFTKVILPMMRKAGKIISIGSQVQAGQDIDVTSLGILKGDWLDTINPAGLVTSSWNQAMSIQAENGLPLTGPDLPKSDQVFNKGNPFDVFDDVPALGAACGALESTFGEIFSIATGPISYVVTGQILKHLLPALADWLSGSPLNPVASGAEFGNIVNYGARLSANDQSAGVGGVQLSHKAEVALKETDSSLDQKDFDSKSFAYRVFNTGDSRTLASHLIDNRDLAVPDSVAGMFSGLGHMFASILRLPATMLSGTASAASGTYNYHGLKKIGFSASELGDPRFDNPFANACHVVGCPDAKPHAIHGIFENSDKASKYTDLAKKCFGVDITHDGDQWTTDSLTESVNVESKDYPSKDCSSGDINWLRVRFWLLDTSTMEGYACYENLDDQSCHDLGFDDGTDDTGGGGGGGGGTTGLPGGGKGPFTTDTSHPAYPGVEQMLARAKKIGQTTAGPPFTKEDRDFCANFGGTCTSLCESAAEWIWLNHRGVYPDPYTASNSAWHTATAAGKAHPGDRSPPIGALLIYSGTEHGHVAVYVGDNLVFSTDILGSGGVYVAPAGLIESKWGMHYVGWMDPYFNGKVGN